MGVFCRDLFDTPEWKSCIGLPSLPYVLKMLTGLCHWHFKTQEALLPMVGELHSLEQVASDQHIGTLAEYELVSMLSMQSPWRHDASCHLQELLISGLPDIDVDDWQRNAEYSTRSRLLLR